MVGSFSIPPKSQQKNSRSKKADNDDSIDQLEVFKFHSVNVTRLAEKKKGSTNAPFMK